MVIGHCDIVQWAHPCYSFSFCAERKVAMFTVADDLLWSGFRPIFDVFLRNLERARLQPDADE